ncbi:MAG TPA: ABC transporter permease [Ktedonosporobacter sp.]|nr:ABC transporter permease [Ktedonosporobacter sp.]
MNTALTNTTVIEQSKLHSARPSFLGIVRGELLKISRLWMTWIMLVMWLGVITLPYLIAATTPSTKEHLDANALAFYYNEAFLNLSVLRIFSGFFLLILTAYVIGQEYQLGTIRILLARGVGRLQLLGAKLLTMGIIALALFIGGLLINAILSGILLSIVAGNLNSLSALTSAYWWNIWLYLLTILISMGVTILLATGVSVVGRVLAFGVSAAVAWFAVDNFGLLFLMLGYRATHNDAWLNVSAYVLGPNLNAMPTVILPAQLKAESVGITPWVPVDGTHTLLVALVYALIFVGTAIFLTWKRDVKE